MADSLRNSCGWLVSIAVLLFAGSISHRAVAFPLEAPRTIAHEVRCQEWIEPLLAIEPEPAAALTQRNGWFIDSEGRYLLFRGANFGSRSKHPPYLPVLPLADTLSERADSDSVVRELRRVDYKLEKLHDLGFNVMRLLVIWKGIEPRLSRDSAGEHYLNMLRLVTDRLHCKGIYVILDFHQDIASEAYGGDGFPDWALAEDSTEAKLPRPTQTAAWGLRYYDIDASGKAILKFFGKPTDPRLHIAVRRTLQQFWKNSLRNDTLRLSAFPVRSHLVRAIAKTAAAFQGEPGILGYEALNEPHPVGLGKVRFEQTVLPEFYRQVEAAIRQNDKFGFLFVEPRMDWTTFVATDNEPVLRFGDLARALHFTQTPVTYLDLSGMNLERTVFAFHFYDPWLLLNVPFIGGRQRYWRHAFSEMRSAAASRGLIPFLTEFGCTQDAGAKDRRFCIDGQFQQVEAQQLNSTYWNFDMYASEKGHDNWNDENLSLLRPDASIRDAAIVARPYPLRSAAIPRRIFFNSKRKTGCIVLEGPSVPAPTIVFIPKRIQFPDGFVVDATGVESGLRWDEQNQLLAWRADPSLERQLLVIHAKKQTKLKSLNNWRSVLPQDCRGKTAVSLALGQP